MGGRKNGDCRVAVFLLDIFSAFGSTSRVGTERADKQHLNSHFAICKAVAYRKPEKFSN